MARRRTRRGGIGEVTRLQVGTRDDISTRKRMQSTFALTSGEGRADLASVAPDDGIDKGRAAWRRARIERATDALLGMDSPAPYRG